MMDNTPSTREQKREPPISKKIPIQRGQHDWHQIAEAARHHPDLWVRALENVPRSIQQMAKRGSIAAFKNDPHWTYELSARDTVDNRADIWVRARRKARKK